MLLFKGNYKSYAGCVCYYGNSRTIQSTCSYFNRALCSQGQGQTISLY